MSATLRFGIVASPKQRVLLASLWLGGVLHLSACTTPINASGSTTTSTEEDKERGGEEEAKQDSTSGKSTRTSSEEGVGNRAGPTKDYPTTGTGWAPSSSGDSATTTEEEPAACKDGEQQPCAELPDGTKVVFPNGEPQGSCKRGLSTCDGGKWGACVGTVGPASKDTCSPGNDDNCNGKPNDHCDCTPGEIRFCGTNVGECSQGVMTCESNGKWSDICLGEVKPRPELCDGMGLDEDCNGAADRDDPKCACLDDDTRACSVPGKRGDCRLGRQDCIDGRFAQECTPRFQKAKEFCGVRDDSWGRASGDEDCDGSVDESDSETPAPQGCQYYFEDKDGDRYGAKGENFVSEKSEATFGCACDASKVPASWRKGPKEKANADCGDDCRDKGGELVFPGTTKFYDEPSKCLEKLGAPNLYDYNCDGKESLSKEPGFSCKLDGDNKCVASGYWKSENPVCGSTEVFHLPEDCVSDGDNGCKISDKKRERKVDCQ